MKLIVCTKHLSNNSSTYTCWTLSRTITNSYSSITLTSIFILNEVLTNPII